MPSAFDAEESPRPEIAPTQADDLERTAELVQVLDQYLADLKEGQAPGRQALLAAHPHLAEQLDKCLAGLEFIHGSAAQRAIPKQLSDFRIVREVGRGGMGAVYEAEQVSLGRRVALKVLRFAPVSDREAIGRFQREAETVARLHHTNIVPIYSVGSENGVNYYAMQFIEGRSLAEVLAEAKAPLKPGDVAQWGLQAAEQYSLEGWYWSLLYAAYASGGILMVALPVIHLSLRLWRRMKPRPTMVT